MEGKKSNYHSIDCSIFNMCQNFLITFRKGPGASNAAEPPLFSNNEGSVTNEK